MAYKISDECIECGSCVPECPVDCIAEGTPYLITQIFALMYCAPCVQQIVLVHLKNSCCIKKWLLKIATFMLF